MRSVLLPLDGSALALRAVPYAARIAKLSGCPLVLVRAVAPSGNRFVPRTEAPRLRARGELEVLAERLRGDGLAVEARVVAADAVTAIVDTACPIGVGIIVMSSHGRGGPGRSLYGSVADGVIRRARVPVLIVPPFAATDWRHDAPSPILVPLDGSPLAESALRPASELADVLGASLHLLRVVWPPHHAAYEYLIGDPDDSALIPEATTYLEEVAAHLGTPGRQVEVQATIGLPQLTIAHVAAKTGAGVIAMATHGRGGLRRALLGSIAIATLQRTEVPVLLVRPDIAVTPGPVDVESRSSALGTASRLVHRVSPR
jgi:nucleotide-binding universal stress UspA family protein